jgi:hypothetical protein
VDWGLLGRTMAPGKFVPSGRWSIVVYFAFLVLYYTIHVSVSVSVWYLYYGGMICFFFGCSMEYEIDV